mmetsp:Transcript_30901/g.35519  ORF Transcript_30901/g.35519 Transcript_30901/m.35519 type:complete len:226 (+) Transcript_30901:1456-2133(+)
MLNFFILTKRWISLTNSRDITITMRGFVCLQFIQPFFPSLFDPSPFPYFLYRSDRRWCRGDRRCRCAFNDSHSHSFLLCFCYSHCFLFCFFQYFIWRSRHSGHIMVSNTRRVLSHISNDRLWRGILQWRRWIMMLLNFIQHVKIHSFYMDASLYLSFNSDLSKVFKLERHRDVTYQVRHFLFSFYCRHSCCCSSIIHIVNIVNGRIFYSCCKWWFRLRLRYIFHN